MIDRVGVSNGIADGLSTGLRLGEVDSEILLFP